MKIIRYLVTQEQLIEALNLPEDTVIFDIERRIEHTCFGIILTNSNVDDKLENGHILNVSHPTNE